MHVKRDPVRPNLDFCSGLFQFTQHRIQNIRARVFNFDVASGRSSSNQIGPCFNTVRHDRIRTAVQAFDTLNDDGVGSLTGDFRTHFNQAIGQIDHLRLTGGILDHSFTCRERSSHHDIFGAGHRDHIHKYLATHQPPFHAGFNIAILDNNLSSHGLQGADMEIDGPAANSASPR